MRLLCAGSTRAKHRAVRQACLCRWGGSSSNSRPVSPPPNCPPWPSSSSCSVMMPTRRQMDRAVPLLSPATIWTESTPKTLITGWGQPLGHWHGDTRLQLHLFSSCFSPKRCTSVQRREFGQQASSTSGAIRAKGFKLTIFWTCRQIINEHSEGQDSPYLAGTPHQPVIMMTRMPACLHIRTAPRTSFLGGSSIPTQPTKVRSDWSKERASLLGHCGLDR